MAWQRRKCSFRFLLDAGNVGRVITQDMRRRVRIVTGDIEVPAQWWHGQSRHQQRDFARSMGCSVIIRQVSR